MKSLELAEGLTDGLVARPDRMTGKALVAILSTMDDVSVGAGSTRFELLSAVITKNVPNSSDLVLMSEAANSCQKSLFNAGNDYVELVLNYIGAQDNALVVARGKRWGHTLHVVKCLHFEKFCRVTAYRFAFLAAWGFFVTFDGVFRAFSIPPQFSRRASHMPLIPLRTPVRKIAASSGVRWTWPPK
jgi:hypothetical protein